MSEPSAAGLGSTGRRGAACPACGRRLDAAVHFCPTCGTAVGASSGRRCAECGTPAAATAKYCSACSAHLASGGRDAPPTRESAGPTTPGHSLLLLNDAGETVRRYALRSGETSIGREGADLAFPDDHFLSPFHAMLTVRVGEVTLRDLGSRNGTWVFITEPHRLSDGDRLLVGSQLLLYRRLGYPGPHPPERDATRRMGSLLPSADIASVIQLRADGSERDTLHLSPGRSVIVGRERGHWNFPYDASMSSMHAEIRSEDADFVLVDLGSRNGVAVAARGEVPLAGGTKLMVGDKMLRVDAP